MPTAAERAGDFSASGLTIYDPTQVKAGTAQDGSTIYTRTLSLTTRSLPAGSAKWRFTHDQEQTINTTLDNPAKDGFNLPAGVAGGAATDIGSNADQSFFSFFSGPDASLTDGAKLLALQAARAMSSLRRSSTSSDCPFHNESPNKYLFGLFVCLAPCFFPGAQSIFPLTP